METRATTDVAGAHAVAQSDCAAVGEITSPLDFRRRVGVYGTRQAIRLPIGPPWMGTGQLSSEPSVLASAAAAAAAAAAQRAEPVVQAAEAAAPVEGAPVGAAHARAVPGFVPYGGGWVAPAVAAATAAVTSSVYGEQEGGGKRRRME